VNETRVGNLHGAIDLGVKVGRPMKFACQVTLRHGTLDTNTSRNTEPIDEKINDEKINDEKINDQRFLKMFI
jgi:hypothetical protein